MRKPRLYVNARLQSGRTIDLPDSAARHVVQVLRLKVGAPVTLFDGNGGEFDGCIESTQRRRVCVQVNGFHQVERESPLDLRLALGVSRGSRMDFAVQKAVEIGASNIQPLLTERTVVQLDQERSGRRLDHWRGIVMSACEQCGRNRLPQMESVLSFDDWLAGEEMANETERRLVLNPRANQSLSDMETPPGPVTLLVGPEGGLSDDEMAAAIEAGYVSIRMGPRTLRTETAVLTGLAAIQLQWGDLTTRPESD